MLRADDVMLATLLKSMESGAHRKKGPVQPPYYHFLQLLELVDGPWLCCGTGSRREVCLETGM